MPATAAQNGPAAARGARRLAPAVRAADGCAAAAGGTDDDVHGAAMNAANAARAAQRGGYTRAADLCV